MTDIEKMKKAQIYIRKLADGINPIDNTYADEDDVINDIRISRCLFYVSELIENMIENQCEKVKSPLKSSEKENFYLTISQREKYAFSEEPISMSAVIARFNELIDLDTMKKLRPKTVKDWLINRGLLKIVVDSAGYRRKYPTKEGAALGICMTLNEFNGQRRSYVAYDRNAQQFIMDNLDTLINLNV